MDSHHSCDTVAVSRQAIVSHASQAAQNPPERSGNTYLPLFATLTA
jgi:hypothetical protein